MTLITAAASSSPTAIAPMTAASLQTDLLARGERAARLHNRVRQLEKRLSEALGEQAWRESGLGTPADIDALNQKIIYLEQQAIELRLQLEEQGAGGSGSAGCRCARCQGSVLN
ncbi:MAG TPA: hypothetical protein VLW50_02490 [Streptosporangiaceae bacterium]|nr:hypothetical protein [Streptosporangiaceae bacterium]